MHIVLITAGGAGMFCGSCMHDNTWARALLSAGCEVTLLPTYTPIRVDEPNVSDRHVFLGGLNVYLEFHSRLWRRLPRAVTRWLDTPWLINLATRFAVSNDSRALGDLTLAMLAGEHGPQHRELDELAEFVGRKLQPDVVIYSNALLVGTLRRLKEDYRGRVFCTLQGDDVFLDSLPAGHKQQAIDIISARAQEFDGFFVHSEFYRDYIAEYLRLPRERFRRLPLSIDLAGHDGQPGERAGQPFTVGYFARIAPEKGLHHLAEAFRLLHRRQPAARLRIGGYLGPQHRRYFRDVQRTLRSCAAAVEYAGSPESHAAKVAFFRSIDVLSVPTEFQEPKGLYVLEALANGVPVVQPRHGAFPELVDATGGGRLVAPGNPQELADALEELLLDPELRYCLGATGQVNVRSQLHPQAMAAATLRALDAGNWQGPRGEITD